MVRKDVWYLLHGLLCIFLMGSNGIYSCWNLLFNPFPAAPQDLKCSSWSLETIGTLSKKIGPNLQNKKPLNPMWLPPGTLEAAEGLGVPFIGRVLTSPPKNNPFMTPMGPAHGKGICNVTLRITERRQAWQGRFLLHAAAGSWGWRCAPPGEILSFF